MLMTKNIGKKASMSIFSIITDLQFNKFAADSSIRCVLQANAIVAKVGYATYIKKPEELNKRFVKVSEMKRWNYWSEQHPIPLSSMNKR